MLRMFDSTLILNNHKLSWGLRCNRWQYATHIAADVLYTALSSRDVNDSLLCQPIRPSHIFLFFFFRRKKMFLLFTASFPQTSAKLLYCRMSTCVVVFQRTTQTSYIIYWINYTFNMHIQMKVGFILDLIRSKSSLFTTNILSGIFSYFRLQQLNSTQP